MHKAHFHKSEFHGIDVMDICSDRTFPRHTHDEFGLGYMVSGGQKSWSGRGLVEASANNVITVNPGEVHDGIGYTGKARHWKMLFIKPEKLAGLMDCAQSSLELHHPVVAHRYTSHILSQAVESLIVADADVNECEQLLMVAFYELFTQNTPTQIEAIQNHSDNVALLLEQIQDEWVLPLSLEDLASTVKMSRYQTLRHFRKEIGMTPHAYLTQLRVKNAKRLLEIGRPLIEVAMECGFSDQSHMNRLFKRQFGISPGKVMRTN